MPIRCQHCKFVHKHAHRGGMSEDRMLSVIDTSLGARSNRKIFYCSPVCWVRDNPGVWPTWKSVRVHWLKQGFTEEQTEGFRSMFEAALRSRGRIS